MLSGFQFAKQSSVPTMRLVHTQAENLWNGSQAHGSESNGEQFLLNLLLIAEEMKSENESATKTER